ncbi:hypothetical protein HDU96_005479 [Phlyctochytrium bullatum]|nr:hypothetical protein HDU96_005479 [Phlyctochytrium bullatum]
MYAKTSFGGNRRDSSESLEDNSPLIFKVQSINSVNNAGADGGGTDGKVQSTAGGDTGGNNGAGNAGGARRPRPKSSHARLDSGNPFGSVGSISINHQQAQQQHLPPNPRVPVHTPPNPRHTMALQGFPSTHYGQSMYGTVGYAMSGAPVAYYPSAHAQHQQWSAAQAYFHQRTAAHMSQMMGPPKPPTFNNGIANATSNPISKFAVPYYTPAGPVPTNEYTQHHLQAVTAGQSARPSTPSPVATPGSGKRRGNGKSRRDSMSRTYGRLRQPGQRSDLSSSSATSTACSEADSASSSGLDLPTSPVEKITLAPQLST